MSVLQLSNVEVWFQRPKDIVRKLVSGDLDLGIVGLDTVSEFGQVRIKKPHMKIILYSYSSLPSLIRAFSVQFIQHHYP